MHTHYSFCQVFKLSKVQVFMVPLLCSDSLVHSFSFVYFDQSNLSLSNSSRSATTFVLELLSFIICVARFHVNILERIEMQNAFQKCVPRQSSHRGNRPTGLFPGQCRPLVK